MQKFTGLIALLVLAATVACGGMSFEDYAEECGDWVEIYGFHSDITAIFAAADPETSLEYIKDDYDDADDSLEDWKALSPPDELKVYHDTRTEIIQLSNYTFQKLTDLVDELDDLRDDRDDARRSERGDFDDQIKDLEDEMSDLYEELEDELKDLTEESTNAKEDLSDSMREELFDANCT